MTTETQNVTEELKDFAESAEKAGLTSGDRVIGRAIARITELETVVERLPKTADGKPVIPGDAVWIPGETDVPLTSIVWSGEEGIAGPDQWYATFFLNWIYGGQKRSGYCDLVVSDCYSTREAALAAKEARDATSE